MRLLITRRQLLSVATGLIPERNEQFFNGLNLLTEFWIRAKDLLPLGLFYPSLSEDRRFPLILDCNFVIAAD